MNRFFVQIIRITVFVFLFALVLAGEKKETLTNPGEENEYSYEEAVDILNESKWARQQTVTRVVPGVGSGEYGEKEIFNRYYIRILSAPPIQKAYRTIRGQFGNKTDSPADEIPGNPEFDDLKHIVIGVAFRSNQCII